MSRSSYAVASAMLIGVIFCHLSMYISKIKAFIMSNVVVSLTKNGEECVTTIKAESGLSQF
jgi:hypothetical protein